MPAATRHSSLKGFDFGRGVGRASSEAALPQNLVGTLSAAELRDLNTFAHRKSRRVVRNLSFPALNPDQKSVLARAKQVPEKVEPRRAPTLERALIRGKEEPILRELVKGVAQPLTEDFVTSTCANGGSLDWVNVKALSREVDEEARALGFRGEDVRGGYLGGAGSLTLPMTGEERNVLGGLDEPGSGAGAGSGSPARAQADLPVLVPKGLAEFHRRHWPSLATFEKHYRPPEAVLPSRPRPPSAKMQPLPEALPTISALEERQYTKPTREETSTLASQAYLFPGLLDHIGREQAQPVPNSPRQQQRPTGIFEAAAVYRATCRELGLVPLSKPVPFFSSERVEITNGQTDICTRQCYAIAKTIRTCAPGQIEIANAHLTDMGCAEIVEASMSTGHLRTLSITGCWLNYRTCTALHSGLRSRTVGSFTELRLSYCGIGGDLEAPLTELEANAVAAYSRSRAVLLGDAEERERRATPPGDVGQGLGEGHGSSTFASKEPNTSAAKAQDGDAELPSEPVEPTPLLLPLFAPLARPGCALRSLDMSKTMLSLATVTMLARSLATTPLEALHLNNCYIQDDSLLALAEGIAQNRFLLSLHLRGNCLSGAPGPPAALFDAVGRHARLAHFDLADNLLPRKCVEELCAALRWSCALVAIHLLSAGGPMPDSNAIAEATKAWVEANVREGDESYREVAAPTAPAASSSAASPVKKGELEVECPPAQGGELVLCRALHVDGLGSWRVAKPAPPRPPAPVKPPTADTPLRAPRSWMPACCWVCSQCSAVDYHWVVPDAGDGDETGGRTARVFVRPSFADFSRVELKRQRIAGAKRVCFSARLLVPPGSHCHLFEAAIGTKTQLLWACGEASAELGEATLTPGQREALERLCRQHRYCGRINTLRRVEAEEFQIPEPSVDESKEEAEVGTWDDDPERQRRFRECYEVDLLELHMEDLCHADEESEVKETLWELYPRLYETYAVFAGRSQWPLVRHVDVYGFFDEARILERSGPLAAAPANEGDFDTVASASLDTEGPEPLSLQDVQQMILQTFAPVQRRCETSNGGTSVEAGSVSPDTLSNWAAAVHQRTREGAPITRPQFIEVLLRAAIALHGVNPSTSSAFRKFAAEIISLRIMQPPLSPFPRGVLLQAGEVAEALLARRKTLREAWERFGGSENAFQSLAQLLKLCDRSFTVKHVASIYALTRRPHADFREASKRSPSLRYDEFCEALARLALVWQRTPLRSENMSTSAKRKWPPQPLVGRPVRQIAVAARVEAFLAKLAERMKPSVVPSSVL